MNLNQLIYVNIVALLIAVSVALPTGSFAGETGKYPSPDGKLTALIIPLSGAAYGAGENRIEIRSRDGSLVFSQDYASEDKEHGFGVEHAAWTPDSTFFVYSLSSSGGHQPWHFPTDFIEIGTLKSHRLDEYIGPVTDPDFKLLAPDRIQTVAQRKSDLKTTTFELRLSELVSGSTETSQRRMRSAP